MDRPAEPPAGHPGPENPQPPGASRLASPWARIAARLLDGLVIGVISRTAMGLTVDRSVESLDPSGVAVQATWIAFGIGVLLTCAGVFAYNTIPVVRTGATPGKQLLKIKIVRGDGSPVSWSTAAARATLPIVTGIVGLAPLLWPAVFVVPLVSLVLLFVDGRRRSLEDRVAGTIVVKAQS